MSGEFKSRYDVSGCTFPACACGTFPDDCLAPKQRCYLAGPMRGIPEYNFPAFYAAAASLRERGVEVWSPAENDVHADGFDPAKDTAQPMRHYMKRDLPAVLDADFVAVLPGWERSQGAQLEVHVARTCGIPVLHADSLMEVIVPSETKECRWSQDDDGNYQTGCGEMFFFDTGSRTENKAAWCQYCGGKITGAA